VDLRRFLKQTVSYQRKTGENDRSEPLFGEPARTLPARVDEEQRAVRGAGGVEVVSTTNVMLVEEIQVGDKIDGLDVQARESMVDIDGATVGWIAYL
jgi:hypothetical protein